MRESKCIHGTEAIAAKRGRGRVWASDAACPDGDERNDLVTLYV